MTFYAATDDAVLAELGRRLRQRRLDRNLSQQELADRAGLDRTTVGQLERDGRASLAIYEAEDNVLLRCELVRTYMGEQAQADIKEMAHRYDPIEAAAVSIARFQTEERVTFILRPTKVNIHGDPK